MVYIVSWDDFVERSVQLFRTSPQNTRYVMKYRHYNFLQTINYFNDNISILSSVFIGQCLKFKTDQAQDAKKMEKLNNIFFTLMARGPETDITEVTGKEQAAQPPKRGRGRKQ
ncbi:signal recognition particle 9 kDa protein-like [Bidens hawaiensis]|uniref:signal recognition particle 9 kDa protein-like n=1 Tax=Bidens hawaiensis TaxID=980011 RepID=UPI00404B2CFC